ncbi:MAG: fibronectin type III domain-containing protein [Methylococcaceae bacterium]
MRRIKVMLDFMIYPVVEKVPFYRNIAIQVADTSLFANLPVPLATIKTVIDDLESALLAAKDGAHSAIAIRNDKEIVADELFRDLAAYVNTVASGDETLIIQSGFHASKQPTAHQKPEIAAYDGPHSGSVLLKIKAIEGAVAYIWQYIQEGAPNSASVWITVNTSTVAHFQIDHLIPGETYSFRYASISSDGTSDFCTPVSKIVI